MLPLDHPTSGAPASEARTVVLAPATFGYGPSSQATTIGRAIRSRSGSVRLIAVADGPSVSYLMQCGMFDAVVPAEPDRLPPWLVAGDQGPPVIVPVTDFARAAEAIRRGLPTVVVDALYWMWDKDPIDPRSADAYLCLAFPGVAERVSQIERPCPGVKIIPQISDPLPDPLPTRRRGSIINLGGGVTPLRLSYDYMASLVNIVCDVLHRNNLGPTLVTCSEAAANQLRLRGVGARVSTMALPEMINALCSCELLVTLPGLSIIWEAARTGVATLVVPGISYSQHRLVKAYVQFIEGMRFLNWDDLSGYESLPAGLDEGAGVKLATGMADRFSADPVAQQALAAWLECQAREGPPAPRLRPGHPWGNFLGADRVAEEVLAVCFKGRTS